MTSCNDDILDPSLERSLIGSINYVVCMTLGNAMLLGIVDFERWGGDPMKRTVLNQLTSFACSCIILHGTWTGSIYQWIILMGPAGPGLAMGIVIGRNFLTIMAFLALVEHILIQCLIVFKWGTVVLLDDFLFRFLSCLNVTVSSLIAGIYYFFELYENENYAVLSCRESRPAPRGIIQTILIITAAIGYAALKYKWTKLRQQTIEIEENNSFNNRKENAPIMSTGQLMINAVGLFMVGMPLFLLSSRLFSGQAEMFVVRYREIIALNCTNIIFPIRVYWTNKDLRKHIQEKIMEICSDLYD